MVLWISDVLFFRIFIDLSVLINKVNNLGDKGKFIYIYKKCLDIDVNKLSNK